MLHFAAKNGPNHYKLGKLYQLFKYVGRKIPNLKAYRFIRICKLIVYLKKNATTCFIYYRKSLLQITQPSQYRYTQLQYRFAIILLGTQYIVYAGSLLNSALTNCLLYSAMAWLLLMMLLLYCLLNLGAKIINYRAGLWVRAGFTRIRSYPIITKINFAFNFFLST